MPLTTTGEGGKKGYTKPRLIYVTLKKVEETFVELFDSSIWAVLFLNSFELIYLFSSWESIKIFFPEGKKESFE